MDNLKLCISENTVDNLHAIVDSGSGRFMCFTRLDSDVWIICASDGCDVWRLEMDNDELEAHRDLASLNMDAFLARFRNSFLSGDVQVAQAGVKLTLSLGRGSQMLEFELYEAKANERKAEIQNILFRLAENVTSLKNDLQKANTTISTMKSQQTQGAGAAAALLGLDHPHSNKSHAPKAPPRQVGMSTLNPGSKKRKQAKGVTFD